MAKKQKINEWVQGAKLIELLVAALEEQNTLKVVEYANKLLAHKVSEALSAKRKVLAEAMFGIKEGQPQSGVDLGYHRYAKGIVAAAQKYLTKIERTKDGQFQAYVRDPKGYPETKNWSPEGEPQPTQQAAEKIAAGAKKALQTKLGLGPWNKPVKEDANEVLSRSAGAKPDRDAGGNEELLNNPELGVTKWDAQADAEENEGEYAEEVNERKPNPFRK